MENTILHLYDDADGNCSIGTGHLVHMGRTGTNLIAEEPYANGITQEQNDSLLSLDMSVAEHEINWCVKVPLNQNQFDCICDFVFNEGTGNLLHSTLLQVLNAGQYTAVPDQLRRWIYGKGVTLPGLVVRRKAEVDLWNTPV